MNFSLQLCNSTVTNYHNSIVTNYYSLFLQDKLKLALGGIIVYCLLILHWALLQCSRAS